MSGDGRRSGGIEPAPDGLLLGGDLHPLWSGEVHYWRLDPSSWPRVLDTVADLGFTTVSSYLPWSRHERESGVFDFETGSRAVSCFLDLVAERGLKFIARPGPNAGAELEDSGWPRRVLDDVRCQARRPDGRGYLLPTSVHHAFMPSYASTQTLGEIARWYDAVIPLLAARQWPAGPVVASHVDNELGFHFQGHAFAMDYHPDALAQWVGFLAERYRSINALNHAYGSRYPAFESVPAPRDGREEPELRRLDWVAFRAEHLRRTLTRLARMQRERGLDRVVLVHNDYPRKATPLDTGALERSGAVDVAAGDIYSTRQGGRYVRDYARYLSGSSRLPYLAEMGVGWLALPWLLPMAVNPVDVEHTVWRALSGGIRAANVFMLVERDRWYASPISTSGEPREPLAGFYRRLLDLLRDIGWQRLRRQPPVLVLDNRAEGHRSAARAVRGDMVPAFRQVLPLDHRLFDGEDAAGAALQSWRREVLAALDLAGLDWDEATTTASADLAAYRVVILPVVDTADPQLLELAGKAAKGGTVLIVGPGEPELDPQLRPLPQTWRHWRHAPDATALTALLPRPDWRSDSTQLDLTELRDRDHRVLVAVNGSDQEVHATITGPAWFRLVGRWRPETLSGAGSVRVDLPAWGVQVYEVRDA